jgi:hypothetical protein
MDCRPNPNTGHIWSLAPQPHGHLPRPTALFHFLGPRDMTPSSTHALHSRYCISLCMQADLRPRLVFLMRPIQALMQLTVLKQHDPQRTTRLHNHDLTMHPSSIHTPKLPRKRPVERRCKHVPPRPQRLRLRIQRELWRHCHSSASVLPTYSLKRWMLHSPHTIPHSSRFSPALINATCASHRKSSGTPCKAHTCRQCAHVLIYAGSGSPARRIRRV